MIGEGLAARLAGEGALLGVRAQVLHQRPLHVRRERAERASETSRDQENAAWQIGRCWAVSEAAFEFAESEHETESQFGFNQTNCLLSWFHFWLGFDG